MSTETSIVGLTRSQIPEVGEVLARAFLDDPIFVWALPDQAKRERALPRFMISVTRYGMLLGDVYTTGGAVEGGAVWFPPGKAGTSIVGMFRSGMVIALLRMGLPSASRFMGAIDFLDKLHKRDVTTEHWYLATLGVDPPHQGRGIGSALIAPVLTRTDSLGLTSYLETTKERNVPFYRRHGFDLVVEDDLPNNGPRFWTMKREPK